MAAVNPVVDQTPGAANSVDPESAEWLGALAGRGPRQEAALARLHEMLLRIAQRECRRRGPRLRITGPELEDPAYQFAGRQIVGYRRLPQCRARRQLTQLPADSGPQGGGIQPDHRPPGVSGARRRGWRAEYGRCATAGNHLCIQPAAAVAARVSGAYPKVTENRSHQITTVR